MAKKKSNKKVPKDSIPQEITEKDFVDTLRSNSFDLKEDFRSKWYYLILERLEKFRRNKSKNYKMSDDEAILYIAFISQWNRANRKITEIKYDEFKEFMTKNDPVFNKMRSLKIDSSDYTMFKEDIIKSISELKDITGIECIGAAKILHMRLPSLFVPIDNDIAKQNVYEVKIGRNFGETYFEFLNKVKKSFKRAHVGFENNSELRKGYNNSRKTFAKAIDEYNFLKVHRNKQGF
jgi:uncharacterized protein YuzE